MDSEGNTINLTESHPRAQKAFKILKNIYMIKKSIKKIEK